MGQKIIKIIYWVITFLFAAFMIFTGIVELMQTENAKNVLTDLGYPVYLLTILGVAKIFGAIVILQTRFKTIREWAYAGFSIDILGASASYALTNSGTEAILTPLVFFAVLLASYLLGKRVY